MSCLIKRWYTKNYIYIILDVGDIKYNMVRVIKIHRNDKIDTTQFD